MRTRLVIPAAILVTAAYVKGRRDAATVRPAVATPIPVAVPGDALLRAEAEAADARVLAEADAEELLVLAEEEVAATTVLERPVMDDVRSELDPALLREWAAPAAFVPPPRSRPHEDFDAAALAEWVLGPAPAPAVPSAVAATGEDAVVEIVIDETGHFSLGGWASQAGHMAVCGVTFRDRRDGPLHADRVRLIVEAAENAGTDALVVLGDVGFAPDHEGFTIALASTGPGHFAATGRYEVVSA